MPAADLQPPALNGPAHAGSPAHPNPEDHPHAAASNSAIPHPPSDIPPPSASRLSPPASDLDSHAAEIIQSLTDPTEAIHGLAERFGTNIVDLALWLERPDIQEKLSAVRKLAALHIQMVAERELPHSASALIKAVDEYHYENGKLHWHPASSSPQFLDQRRRARATLNKNVWLLNHLAHYRPGNPTPLPPPRPAGEVPSPRGGGGASRGPHANSHNHAAAEGSNPQFTNSDLRSQISAFRSHRPGPISDSPAPHHPTQYPAPPAHNSGHHSDPPLRNNHPAPALSLDDRKGSSMVNTRALAGLSPRLAVSCALGAAAFMAGAAFATLPPVPVPPQNPITEQKRVLGKILFWDEQLSTSNVVSCGTCHVPNRGGADNRNARNPGLDAILNTPDDIIGSPGVIRSDADNDYQRDPVFALNPQITGRAANSIFASAYAIDLFWDGRARSQFTDPQTGQVVIPVGGGLESQVVGPPVSSVEMAHAGTDWNMLCEKLARVNPLNLATNHPADVASALADRPSYPELFRRAFGDEQITARRIAFAIATYERTLIANQTPFDAFRAGNPNAMTPQQVQGFNAFSGPGSNCAACHNVAQDLFTDQSFRNIGLRPPAEDLGRQIVTGNVNDRGKFKVPSLRNVGLKQTFMHNGQFTSLTQVIQFYARAPGAAPQFPDNRDPIMQNVNVPPQVAPLIQDFLQNALTDPRVASQTFPFDKPTLFVDRPNDRATILGGGVAGSGGVVPRIIAQAPPMIGNFDYRLGIDGALGGATANLGISFNAPVNGRITPQWFAGTVTATGSGAGQGLGTLHWPLSIAQFQPGQVIFAQWFVTDPAAPGGQALSNVARIPLFCGSAGCPPCDADVNCDGAVNGFDIQAMEQAVNGDLSNYCQADPDFNHDGSTNGFDIEAVELVVNGEPCP